MNTKKKSERSKRSKHKCRNKNKSKNNCSRITIGSPPKIKYLISTRKSSPMAISLSKNWNTMKNQSALKNRRRKNKQKRNQLLLKSYMSRGMRNKKKTIYLTTRTTMFSKNSVEERKKAANNLPNLPPIKTQKSLTFKTRRVQERTKSLGLKELQATQY